MSDDEGGFGSDAPEAHKATEATERDSDGREGDFGAAVSSWFGRSCGEAAALGPGAAAL